jgi:hypothetical protein
VSVYNGITAKDFTGFAEKLGLKPQTRHEDADMAIIELAVHNCRSLAMMLVNSGGKGGKYSSIQFWIAWKDGLTADQANAWNSARRYAFAYADEEGHANLQMDVSVVGLTAEGVEHYLGLWSHMIAAFMQDMA